MFEPHELHDIRTHGLWTAVHHEAQLRMIEESRDAPGLDVWLKADSGMGRDGLALGDMTSAHARLQASGQVAQVTLMTHFARADEPDQYATARQVAAFDAATEGLAGDRSLCNSAGTLAWPTAYRD